MADQPNPNPNPSKEEISQQGYAVGGDHNVVHGNVGPGGVVGRGVVTAEQIAGGDIVIGSAKQQDAQQFSDMMVQLRDLVVQAYKSGELNKAVARKVLSSITETADLITQEKTPPKTQVLRRLQYVADVLDAAVDMFNSDGGIAKVLLKALPVATLLIKIASRIF